MPGVHEAFHRIAYASGDLYVTLKEYKILFDSLFIGMI